MQVLESNSHLETFGSPYAEITHQTPIGDNAVYHQAMIEIKSLITDLEEYSALLTPEHKRKLARLCGHVGSNTKPSKHDGPELTILEVQRQYAMILRVQEQLMDPDGALFMNASVRDLSSMINALNSLISLFLRTKREMEHVEDEAILREAVLASVRTLPPENQKVFFDFLEKHQQKRL